MQSERSRDKDGYEAIVPFPSFVVRIFCFSFYLPIFSVERVFTTHYVGGELVAIFAAMSTNVAF